MSQPTPHPIRTWQAATLAAVLWCVAFMGWSWYALSTAFNDTQQHQILDRASRIATDLREHAAEPTPDPAGDQSGGPFDNWAGDPATISAIARQAASDPGLAYLVVWQADGKVAGIWDFNKNGRPVFKEHPFFGPSEWIPLDAPNSSHITRPATIPWNAKAPPVTDVTLPLRWGRAFAGYLSVGFNQHTLNQQALQFAKPLLVQSLIFALAGAIVIVAAVVLFSRALRKARRTQEQNLRARTSLLTERGMLASVLAHEVRSPLTALRFTLHSLRNLIANNPADRQRQIDLADSCEREIRRLDLMLTEFLTHTQVVGAPEVTSLNQVVQEAFDFLRPALERNNIRLILHLDASRPTVSVNADELRQVLLNLAGNAQDAMPRGGTLAVSTVPETDSVNLLVRDSGTGIPADVQERLFEPFFSTKPHGSGLGLALVRRVVSGAGGKIFVESAPNEGATFRIVLPRPMPVQAPPTPEAATVDLPSPLHHG